MKSVHQSTSISEILVTSQGEGFIFSLESLTWRPGPILKQSLMFVSYTQLEDGFLVIGGVGSNSGIIANTVYKFSDQSYEWTLQGRLDIPRFSPSSVPVPNSFLGCK